jgi:hypothetical protein
MRLYNVAEVLVVPYATFDVTGFDGVFEIRGVPVGNARIDALLPQTATAVGKDIEVREGQVTEVRLELPFDASRLEK